MNKWFCVIIAFCFLTACETKDTTPQQLMYNKNISDVFDTDRLQNVDSIIQSMIDNGYWPHCVTMVIHNGKVVHNKAFGWRDIKKGIPCQTDDIFRLASQSKALVCVGLMTLFEEGKIMIDDPVKKYIPEFANPQVLVSYDENTGAYTTRPANKDITIRHLLTHTSGITNDGIFNKIAEQLGVVGHNTLEPITLAENVSKMASLPLRHDPGEQFTYAFNIDVVGRICEIVSGQDIETFMAERVFNPLGMKDTYFHVPAEKADRVVTLYEHTDGALKPSTNELFQQFPYSGAGVFCSPSAGICSTIEDYAKFCQMILNGGEFNNHRILGRKTIEMMMKNGTGHLRGEVGWGLAWEILMPENGHNTIISDGTMRWGGMFGTDYVIDQSENLIIIEYVNCMPNFSGYDPKALIHNIIYPCLK